MKKIRIITMVICLALLAQMGQFWVAAEEYVTEDGTINKEETYPEEDKTDSGTDAETDKGETGPVVNDEFSFNGNTYQVVITSPSITWMEAKQACEDVGGHLATVTSRQEQDFLMTITGGRDVWIGGYRDEAYNWFWVTGEEWDYTNWADGEPNDSSNVVKDEKYVVLWPEQWNDLANGNIYEQNGYVIEWESDDEEIEDPEDPEVPEDPDKDKNKKKKKKPNPPKQITIQRAKGIIKGYCKKNLRVFAKIKNKTYKTVANKKGRFKFKVPKIKVAVVRLYCKSKEGVKSNVVKARCNSMISKKNK